MSKIIQWNTGRHYGPDGQRIVAELEADRRVLFYDHTRMISGRTKRALSEALNQDWQIEEFTMREYDRGQGYDLVSLYDVRHLVWDQRED